MAEDRKITRSSRFLSLVLRHRPEKIGIKLDHSGWVDIKVLLVAMAKHNRSLTRDQLQEVVDTNNKKRFAISEDGKRIRASQGHSVDVDLGYNRETPPVFLYHGTVSRFLDSIKEQGLQRGSRHHVHLSEDPATATDVGGRRGSPVVLTVKARYMHDCEYAFFQSANGVWLTEHVPPEFISFPRTEWPQKDTHDTED